MSTALEEITEQALKLSVEERLALASRLLISDPDADTAGIDAAWEEEIAARVKAIDEGTAVGIPYDEVIGAARDRGAT